MKYDFWRSKKRTRLGTGMVRRFNRRLAALIARTAGASGSLLEIGPGNGVMLEHLKGKGYRYTAIEPNAELARACRELAPGAEIREERIPPIGLPDGSFDIVYMGHVLEHFRDHEEAGRVLAEVARVLKPDGRFVLLFPDYLSYREDFFDIDYTHGFVTTLSRVRYILADNGLSIRAVRNFNAQFTGIPRILLLPFFFCVRSFFSLLYALKRKELFLKAKITFGRNVVVVAGRTGKP